jgi:DegV family protein with EDD domain
VLDTQQVAMSQGWAAIEAARAAISGLEFDAILARAREVSESGMMLQTNDTLRYLYLGGRVGRAQHLVGTLLKIKPIIGMHEGTIVALGAVRGRLRAYQRMVELMQQRVGEGAKIKIAFSHVAAEDNLAKLKAQVAGHFEQIETIVTELSPALAVHSGPGTVGISFIPS